MNIQKQIYERSVDLEIEVAALRQGFTPLQSRIIASRVDKKHIEDLNSLISPALTQLDSPSDLPDIEKAADRIVNAIENGEHIAIVTDFDADGVDAHAVIKSSLVDYFGVDQSRVHSFIGHRQKDGYGVSINLALRIIEEMPTPYLVITADQGSADHERIHLLKQCGVDVIVTDHHGIPEHGIPTDAYAVINPIREDSKYPDPHIAGTMVAWLLMCVVRQRLITKEVIAASTPKLTGLLDFVGIATIADAMSCAKSVNNRAVIRQALRQFNQPQPRPAWQAIKTLTGLDKVWNETDIAFNLVTRINAKGRMGDSTVGVEFLTTEETSRAFQIVKLLDDENAQRREVERSMRDMAYDLVLPALEPSCAGVVVFLPEGHSGCQGIVAARLVEATGRPSIVLTPKHGMNGFCTGSARSIPGVDVRAALAQVKNSTQPSILEGFGGHKGAAGVLLQAANIDAFRAAFDAAILAQTDGNSLAPTCLTDGDLPDLEPINALAEIAAIGPYGREYEIPVFRVAGTVWAIRPMGNPSLHMNVTIRDYSNREMTLTWFHARRSDRDPLPIQPRDQCVFAVEMATNHFRGRTEVQYLIRACRIEQ